MNLEDKQIPAKPLDSGPFYHGTKVDLRIDDLLQPGFQSNYGAKRKANFVYFTATMDAAI